MRLRCARSRRRLQNASSSCDAQRGIAVLPLQGRSSPAWMLAAGRPISRAPSARARVLRDSRTRASSAGEWRRDRILESGPAGDAGLGAQALRMTPPQQHAHRRGACPPLRRCSPGGLEECQPAAPFGSSPFRSRKACHRSLNRAVSMSRCRDSTIPPPATGYTRRQRRHHVDEIRHLDEPLRIRTIRRPAALVVADGVRGMPGGTVGLSRTRQQLQHEPGWAARAPIIYPTPSRR